MYFERCEQMQVQVHSKYNLIVEGLKFDVNEKVLIKKESQYSKVFHQIKEH